MEEFHFINATDEPSGKVKSLEARKEIRTHVMRNHWATCTRPAFKLASQKRRRESSSLERKASEPYGLSDASSTTGLYTYRASESLDGEISASRPRVGEVESPSRHLNRSADAFVYAGCSLDMMSFSFFHHYALEFHVALCSTIQPISTTKTSNCCSVAIQENAAPLFHAICFHAAMHEAIARGPAFSPHLLLSNKHWVSETQQKSFLHKAKALNQLTRSLSGASDQITEATILCIALFLLAESIVGDIHAIKVHKTGLTRIITMFGGDEVLSPSLKTFLQLIDVKAAITQQARPILSLPRWLQHRYSRLCTSPLQPLNYQFPMLGSYFSEPIFFSQITPELQRCIQYTKYIILVAAECRSKPYSASGYTIDDFIALEYMLLSLPSASAPLHHLENCLRLCLLIYSSTALWRTPLYFGWLRSLSSQLKASLLTLDWDMCIRDVPELLLWMLVLGAYVSNGKAELESKWWVGELRNIAAVLHVNEWDEAEVILKHFFYVPDISAKSWGQTWDGLMGSGNVEVRPEDLGLKHPCNYS